MSGEVNAICHSCVTFLRALAVLALPAGRQVEWLRSLGLGEPGVCDELADEYFQQWLMLPQLVEAGLIPESAVDGLNDLNDLLARVVSPGSEYGSIEALRTAEVWEVVREAARTCIVRLK